MAILLGIVLGFSTLLFIGPVFFYLLKSSIQGGFKAGLFVALGIIVGDIICVLLAIYGFNSFFEAAENKKWIALVGGLLLLAFGFRYLINPKFEPELKKEVKGSGHLLYFVNAFLINFVNPFVFGVWFGFYALNISKLVDKNAVVISLIATLSVIFVTDILKAYFAWKLNKLLKPDLLKIIFRLFGIIMIAFGIRLLIIFFSLYCST